MTEIVKKYTEKVERERVLRVVCDRCGEDVPMEVGYQTRDFELEFTKGDSYPDGGSKEGWCVPDLCDTCVSWLKKTLEDGGVKIQEIDRDW